MSSGNKFGIGIRKDATGITTASTLAQVLVSGNTTGGTDISVSTGDSIVYNNGGFTATISEPTLAGNINLTLPSSSGTIALLSDITADQNIGNDNLPITDDERVLSLNGTTFSRKFRIEDNLGGVEFEVTGNGKVGLGGVADDTRIARVYGDFQADSRVYVGTGGNAFIDGSTVNIARYGGTALVKHQFTNNSGTSFFEIYPAGNTISSKISTFKFTDAGENTFQMAGTLISDKISIKEGSGDSIIEFKGDMDIDIFDTAGTKYATFDQSQEEFDVSQQTVGNIGTAAQYALNVYSRLASSSGIAKFFNSSGALVFDFRQLSGAATMGLGNSAGVQNTFFKAAGLSYFGAGNRLAIGANSGSSTNGTLTIHNVGTPTGVTDAGVLYSSDQAAGNACIHAVSEGGDVVKLFSDPSWTAITGTPTKGGWSTMTGSLSDVKETVKAMYDAMIANGTIKV